MEIRILAPLSLAIASAGFVATLFFRDTFVIGILRSFFEAAMVGGLADWFAVVALFDHPLGLPIPHTAILRTKRKKLEQSLLTMLEKLLPKEDIEAKIRKFNLVDRTIRFWNNKEKRRWLLGGLRRLLIRLVQQLDAAEIAKALTSLIQGISIQRVPVLSKQLSIYLVANRKNVNCIPEKALVGCVNAVNQFCNKQESTEKIEKLLTETLDKKTIFRVAKMAGIPASQFAAKQLAEWLISWLRTESELELQGNRINKLREFYTMLYRNLANELNDPASQISRGIDGFWLNWITGSNSQNVLARHLEQYRADLLEDLEEFESKFIAHISSTVDEFIVRLLQDRSFRTQVETWLNDKIPKIVTTLHATAKMYIKDKLADYSDNELISIIKKNVGRDLQYIRLNGALIGGLVGVSLHCIRGMIH